MSVIQYIHDLVNNLEQGNIDHCLSNAIDLSNFDELSKTDSDLLNALDLNLKKIAQRQLQLETENLRSRIMIQQQHQLLTAHGHEEKVMSRNHQQTDKNNKHKEEDGDDGGGDGGTSRTGSRENGDESTISTTTPEDNLTSIHDSSLLDKLENSYRQHQQKSYFAIDTLNDNATSTTSTNTNAAAGLAATSSSSTTTATPPFNISATATAYPVYFGATMSPSIIAFPAATVQTSSDNIVCPDCVIQAVKVASGVFNGDLGRRITCKHERCVVPGANVEPNAPINTLKNAVNAMADRLQIVADEVSFVAHETAVNGKLGVQARCGNDMKGFWHDFVVNLNSMTQNHLEQVRDIADVSTAIARGDLSKAMTVPVKGETLLLKNTFNTMVNQLNLFASEVSRVAHEVGTEGKLGAQAKVQGADGIWKELTDNVNTMAANLTNQVRDIAQVSKSVARGDLTKKVTVEVRGEMLDLKNTINTMVDQLSIFATEVTRVSLEVGTEGILGGQAIVKDVGGTWKDLTDNVNMMATKITNQVRDIAVVAKAVARGDLSKKVKANAQGEVLELKNTMNKMVDQLILFSAEVRRVSLEVGVEGKLGGQAVVKDVGGAWKDLTDNVNTMAANLTTQVRSIAEVTKAVAMGELSK
ncbi:hypothetical protein G6F42_018512 [Rhizopus arrhizus]|nr:hypothetical protein G6F42_018512 [Rhizopus arrhizus]